MTNKYKLNRNVTRQECEWVLDDASKEDIVYVKGQIVYKFKGGTYGCISRDGIACTFDETGEGPFFEVPKDALDEVV